MIIVHDGKAHSDDFLAACVLSYKTNEKAYRQKYSEDNLSNPNIWVIDQGRQFQPELKNFDHHQIDEEICSFTMILDYFYGKSYREFWPSLKYIEIMDSCGPKRAASFAKVTEDALDIVNSPIHSSVLGAFSKIDGEVPDFFLEIMKCIGKDICLKIESEQYLFKAIEENYKIIDHKDIKILDVTKCIPPKGLSYEDLPTREWSKSNGLNPEVILTVDTRGGGYRMISTNSDCLKFKPNEKSYFTHNSGFLTSFQQFEDYIEILEGATNG
jgi:hypothetical protein